jgi:hypothetical protein
MADYQVNYQVTLTLDSSWEYVHGRGPTIEAACLDAESMIPKGYLDKQAKLREQGTKKKRERVRVRIRNL